MWYFWGDSYGCNQLAGRLGWMVQESSHVFEPLGAGSWLWYCDSPLHGSLLHVVLPFHILSLCSKAGWTSMQHGNQILRERKWKLLGLSRAKPQTYKTSRPLHAIDMNKSEGQPGFKRWVSRSHMLMRAKAAMYRKRKNCWQHFFFFKGDPEQTYTPSPMYS